MISRARCRGLLIASTAVVAVAALTAPAQAQAAAPAATLPGGASSLQETYGAWTVKCHIAEARKVCSLAQIRGNRQTGQRSFAIELRPSREGKTEGVLVLPFGLALQSGIALVLDDKPLGQPVPFSTCVPDGCLAPVSFTAAATDAVKKGKALTVTATPSGGTEPVQFAVALDGFTAALKRVSELAE